MASIKRQYEVIDLTDDTDDTPPPLRRARIEIHREFIDLTGDDYDEPNPDWEDIEELVETVDTTTTTRRTRIRRASVRIPNRRGTLAQLQDIIGYNFVDPNLLQQAIPLHEIPSTRMTVLKLAIVGDKVLDLVNYRLQYHTNRTNGMLYLISVIDIDIVILKISL